MLIPLAHWKRPFGPLVLLLFLILLIAGLPVISVAISMAIANGLGCTLNEGNIHPCPFIGTDLGHLLYFLFASGWFGLLTIPAGAFLLVLWFIAAMVFAIRHLLKAGN